MRVTYVRRHFVLLAIASFLSMLPLSVEAQNAGGNGVIWLQIDAPNADTQVLPPFVVAGWALDEQAVGGTTGMSSVDVWAVPPSGDPIFFGSATLGGSAPTWPLISALHFSALDFH